MKNFTDPLLFTLALVGFLALLPVVWLLWALSALRDANYRVLLCWLVYFRHVWEWRALPVAGLDERRCGRCGRYGIVNSAWRLRA